MERNTSNYLDPFLLFKAPPYEANMYPYGPQQNDNEFGPEDTPYFFYDHCLRIDTNPIGFPFFTERHYKLHVGISEYLCISVKQGVR